MVEGLSKQDDQTLHNAREFIDELLAACEHRREQPISEDELPADAEVIEAKSSTQVRMRRILLVAHPLSMNAERAAGAVVVVTTVGLVFLCSAQHLFSKQACASS